MHVAAVMGATRSREVALGGPSALGIQPSFLSNALVNGIQSFTWFNPAVVALVRVEMLTRTTSNTSEELQQTWRSEMKRHASSGKECTCTTSRVTWTFPSKQSFDI